MSFELYVFRGDIDDDEERWEPLDLARAREVITMLPGIELDADHEAYWPLRVHSVQFFLGTERSVAAPISSGGRTSRTEIRDDWRQILTALFELAERLDAEVGDTGIGRVLDRGALEQELDRYAGREDEPPPRPEPLHEPPGWPYPGYAAMSKDERQQYLAGLLSGKEAGLARLRAATEARNGPELDFTPESLRPLWPWMLEVGETVDPLLEDRSEAPTWAYELARDLSLETLWLLDGVIHYVAEVILRNVPGTRWGLGRGMHDSAAVGKPVLEYADSEFGPVDSLLVLLHSALHYPGFPPGAPRDAPDTLYRLFEDVRAAHERGLRFPT